ncbi:MAG: YceD family protein [Gammaproteobacteria bacterium]
MSERLPLVVDVVRYVETGRRLTGELPLSGMTRLLPLLHNASGAVWLDLQFGKDDLTVANVRGEIRAQLRLQCQRCLQPFDYPVQVKCALGAVTSEAEADKLPGDYEPLLVTSQNMPLAAIVEDELLLALPVAPMHKEGECPAPVQSADAQTSKPSPFAVLGQLKAARIKAK